MVSVAARGLGKPFYSRTSFLLLRWVFRVKAFGVFDSSKKWMEFLDQAPSPNSDFFKKQTAAYRDSTFFRCSKCVVKENCPYRAFTEVNSDDQFKCGLRQELYEKAVRDLDLTDPLTSFAAALCENIADYKLEKIRGQGELTKRGLALRKLIMEDWAKLIEFSRDSSKGKKLNWLWQKVKADLEDVEEARDDVEPEAVASD